MAASFMRIRSNLGSADAVSSGEQSAPMSQDAPPGHLRNARSQESYSGNFGALGHRNWVAGSHTFGFLFRL